MHKVVMTDSSPISIRLKLRCDGCKKKLKMSYCISVIKIKEINCPNCEKVGSWSIVDIESNFPMWGGG